MKTLPQRNAELQGRRVEVVVTDSTDGRRQVELRDLSYGPGIGWYTQKTIRLDPEQVEALMGSLCCAKQSCAKRRSATQRPAQECCHGSSAAQPSRARIIQIAELNRA